MVPEQRMLHHEGLGPHLLLWRKGGAGREGGGESGVVHPRLELLLLLLLDSAALMQVFIKFLARLQLQGPFWQQRLLLHLL